MMNAPTIKRLTREDLENMSERYGRYLDIDNDGVPYRTLPGTHPTKGSFFTRGTSKDEYAIYTEIGDKYIEKHRLQRKWKTASQYMPKPIIRKTDKPCTVGLYIMAPEASTEAYIIYTLHGTLEQHGHSGIPFSEVGQFIAEHEYVFVVEQNRDAQMRTLLINEYDLILIVWYPCSIMMEARSPPVLFVVKSVTGFYKLQPRLAVEVVF